MGHRRPEVSRAANPVQTESIPSPSCSDNDSGLLFHQAHEKQQDDGADGGHGDRADQPPDRDAYQTEEEPTDESADDAHAWFVDQVADNSELGWRLEVNADGEWSFFDDTEGASE